MKEYWYRGEFFRFPIPSSTAMRKVRLGAWFCCHMRATHAVNEREVITSSKRSFMHLVVRRLDVRAREKLKRDLVLVLLEKIFVLSRSPF